MDTGPPGTLFWKTMTINSQINLSLFETCCSTWMHMGPHGSHPRELKDLIAGPLLFFNGLQSLYVPMEWRMANVMTIFRKSKKEHRGNYRPLSLPSVVKLCNYWHLLKNTWKTTQSLVIARFMRRKSCLINLISFCDKVMHLVGQGKPVEVLFYFTKAFDIVSHKICLDKRST